MGWTSKAWRRCAIVVVLHFLATIAVAAVAITYGDSAQPPPIFGVALAIEVILYVASVWLTYNLARTDPTRDPVAWGAGSFFLPHFVPAILLLLTGGRRASPAPRARAPLSQAAAVRPVADVFVR